MQKEKPMMVQYSRIKEENRDAILFFRLGGFYEMFNKDAYIVSKVLGLKVTTRNIGNGKMIPMCGIPKSAAEKHANTLSEKGYGVAICDQVEGEKEPDGIIKRIVTQVVKPKSKAAADIISTEEYLSFLAEFEEQAKIQAETKQIQKVSKPKPEVTLIKELHKLDLDNTPPMTALSILYEWKRMYSYSNDRL